MSARQRVVCGINAVRQALERRAADVECVYLDAQLGAERRARLRSALSNARKVLQVTAEELDRLTGEVRHQGVAALLSTAGPLGESEALERIAAIPRPLLLVLDGIQDPRNFGACLRTADAAGADLVVVARHRNVELTPVVSKVAAGAGESQALAVVPNLARFMKALAPRGVWIVGTADEAERSLFDLDLTVGTALVLGGEGEGLRDLTREHCDYLASLPMHGSVSSLNVAVAAGVCLYEAVRQRSVSAAGRLR
jgi:23S rRNA (guanosine2251-2'-O)-methyltransferase